VTPINWKNLGMQAATGAVVEAIGNLGTEAIADFGILSIVAADHLVKGSLGIIVAVAEEVHSSDTTADVRDKSVIEDSRQAEVSITIEDNRRNHIQLKNVEKMAWEAQTVPYAQAFQQILSLGYVLQHF
jgi:hypothetical protein